MADRPMRPETVVRTFYLWYIGTIDLETDDRGAERAMMKKYVTPHLIRVIENDELPGNASVPFLQTGVWGPYARVMKVSKALIRGSKATVLVTFGGKHPRVIVTLIKSHGRWKIDWVKDASRS
jgi:hypothetical protein